MLNKTLNQINFKKKNCYEKDYQSLVSRVGCQKIRW